MPNFSHVSIGIGYQHPPKWFVDLDLIASLHTIMHIELLFLTRYEFGRDSFIWSRIKKLEMILKVCNALGHNWSKYKPFFNCKKPCFSKINHYYPSKKGAECANLPMLLCWNKTKVLVILAYKTRFARVRTARRWTALSHRSCIDPTCQSHTLDPTPEVPFPRLSAAIRLLIKD